MDERIRSRLLPARCDGGFRLPGKYVWCSSVVFADGKWHAFSSVWPEREDPNDHDDVQVLQNYWTLSTIVRAEADGPEGPYTLCETVLEGQGGDHWSYECCHNPCLVRIGHTYVLYFQTKGQERNDRHIGYATSSSVYGPWVLADDALPLGYNVTNPSVWPEPDGRVRVAFRTEGMKIAIAEAAAYDGPYEIVNPDIRPGVKLEDPFLYHLNGRYHMLLEDNAGQVTGDLRHGVHLVSGDGRHFELFEEEPKAYTHTVAWTDGGETTFERRERAWLIMQAGSPTHLVTGVLEGRHARSIVQPLG